MKLDHYSSVLGTTIIYQIKNRISNNHFYQEWSHNPDRSEILQKIREREDPDAILIHKINVWYYKHRQCIGSEIIYVMP